MPRATPIRQRVRKAPLIISVLLFPITMNYLSPYVIIAAASEGIVNASLIVFATLFVASLFVGRLWCGWLCPGGGLGDICAAVNDNPTPGGRWNWTKWFIWFPWLGLIVFLAASAGGYRSLDPLFLTESGISVSDASNYPIYLIVVAILVGLTFAFGRRAACHHICWMAPFMIIGRKIRNLVGGPALHLVAEKTKCIQCKRCTKECPMSIDVMALVQRADMEHSDCALCGTCVDGCPKDVIHFAFGR